MAQCPKTETESLLKIEAIVTQLHAGQGSVLNELKEIREEQKRTSEMISALKTRVGSIEGDLVISKSNINATREIETSAESVLMDIALLNRRSDDAESRSRRSNLLFFGLEDAARKTWAEAEKLVLDACNDKLGIQINPDTIDRTHRIGRFNPDKKRPIVVKFAFFKPKEAVLRSSYKLKYKHFCWRGFLAKCTASEKETNRLRPYTGKYLQTSR